MLAVESARSRLVGILVPMNADDERMRKSASDVPSNRGGATLLRERVALARTEEPAVVRAKVKLPDEDWCVDPRARRPADKIVAIDVKAQRVAVPHGDLHSPWRTREARKPTAEIQERGVEPPYLGAYLPEVLLGDGV